MISYRRQTEVSDQSGGSVPAANAFQKRQPESEQEKSPIGDEAWRLFADSSAGGVKIDDRARISEATSRYLASA